MVFWITCKAILRAATAVLRQALSTRSDPIIPSHVFGVTTHRRANAACGAFWGVQVVVLTTTTAIVFIGCGDPQQAPTCFVDSRFFRCSSFFLEWRLSTPMSRNGDVRARTPPGTMPESFLLTSAPLHGSAPND